MAEQDTFFTDTHCHRCEESTDGKCFTMSWFTDERICMECKAKEDKIKSQLFMNGIFYEGCGYIPNPEAELANTKPIEVAVGL